MPAFQKRIRNSVDIWGSNNLAQTYGEFLQQTLRFVLWRTGYKKENAFIS